jgi:hypothetical protein
MNRMHPFFAAAVLVAVAVCAPVHAASNRTFVASYGNDANAATNCALGAPCRTFAGALAATNAGGEILALDSAGYGPVTIDRSVSITGPDGVYAGITATSGNGVTIATAGIYVVLKGLTINGVGGSNGILMTNGNSLRVENCTVSGFGSPNSVAGINISAAATVFISNTVVSNGNAGIVLDGGAWADISGVKTINNGYGILLAGPSNATTIAVASNSVFSGNAAFGVGVLGQGASEWGFGACTGCTRKMTVINSEASYNIYGMYVQGTGASITVSNSAATNNGSYGFIQAGGAFRSAQNNVLSDNNVAPTHGIITTGGITY